MFTQNLLISRRLCLPLLGLTLSLTLAGCNNMPSIHAPETSPIHNSTMNYPKSGDDAFTKCPPFNPEQTMCTAQYDPVCVSVKTPSGISYRTAGNACSACGSVSAIGYIKGECS